MKDTFEFWNLYLGAAYKHGFTTRSDEYSTCFVIQKKDGNATGVSCNWSEILKNEKLAGDLPPKGSYTLDETHKYLDPDIALYFNTERELVIKTTIVDSEKNGKVSFGRSVPVENSRVDSHTFKQLNKALGWRFYVKAQRIKIVEASADKQLLGSDFSFADLDKAMKEAADEHRDESKKLLDL